MGYDQLQCSELLQLSNLLLLLSISNREHMSVASRAILSNLFGEQGRQNHPQYLSGFSRALFPTTFLETAVCSHVPVFFFSLQLTLTLLAASICHFHIAALNFKCFFSSTMNLVSFLSFFFFAFVLFCLSLQLFLCYRRQSSGSRGERPNARSSDYQFFLHVQVTIFSFERARASLILILYYEKWLIINSAILLNSCTVIAEMHILSWRFS